MQAKLLTRKLHPTLSWALFSSCSQVLFILLTSACYPMIVVLHVLTPYIRTVLTFMLNYSNLGVGWRTFILSSRYCSIVGVLPLIYQPQNSHPYQITLVYHWYRIQLFHSFFVKCDLVDDRSVEFWNLAFFLHHHRHRFNLSFWFFSFVRDKLVDKWHYVKWKALNWYSNRWLYFVVIQ